VTRIAHKCLHAKYYYPVPVLVNDEYSSLLVALKTLRIVPRFRQNVEAIVHMTRTGQLLPLNTLDLPTVGRGIGEITVGILFDRTSDS